MKELENKAEDQDVSSVGELDSEGTETRKRNYVAISGIRRMSFDEYKPKPQELETCKTSNYMEQHIGKTPMATPPQRHLFEGVEDGLNDFQRDTTEKA